MDCRLCNAGHRVNEKYSSFSSDLHYGYFLMYRGSLFSSIYLPLHLFNKDDIEKQQSNKRSGGERKVKG